MKKVSMIGIPFYSLAKYRGMGMAVEAMRRLGIADVIKEKVSAFADLGDLALSQIEADSGPRNLKNFPQFLHDTAAVFRAASEVGSDDFVFCLGGECTFVPGTVAGFKTKFPGKPGMLWMDAHGDFNTPETTVSGFIGGMCLAFACGRGPKLTDVLERARPLLVEENVVHVGSRSLDHLESEAMEASPLRVYSASEVHRLGIPTVARDAANYLAERSDWIVCHLDVDSIDPNIVSAVNYREQGGLTLEDVRTVVDALQRTRKLRVLDLAAYNPTLDDDHDSGNKLLRLVSDIFSQHSIN
jgi:arginase